MNDNSNELYGEFKGSVDAKLKTIFEEIKLLREQVADLQNFKFYSMGIGATAGFVASIIKGWIIK